MLFNIAFGDKILIGCVGVDTHFYWDAENVASLLRYKAVYHFKLRHVRKHLLDVSTGYWKKHLSKSILDVPLINEFQLKDLVSKRSDGLESICKLPSEWNFLIKVTNGPKFPELVFCTQKEPEAIRFMDWSQSYKDKVLNMDPRTDLPVLTSPGPSPSYTLYSADTRFINMKPICMKKTDEPIKDWTSSGPDTSSNTRILNMEPISKKKTDEPPKESASPGPSKTPPNGPFSESNTGGTPCSPTNAHSSSYEPSEAGPCSPTNAHSSTYEPSEAGPCSPSYESPMTYESSEADYIPCSPSYQLIYELPSQSAAWTPPQKKRTLEEVTSSKTKPSSASQNQRRPHRIYSPLTTDEQLPSSPPPRQLFPGAAPGISVWWDTVPPNKIYMFYGNECRHFIAEN